MSETGIRRRVDAGRLHRVHRGVYAVGHTCLSFEGRCLAAALACGGGTAVSHRSAAALWRILPPHAGSIEVTTLGDGGRKKHPGILTHRSLTLTPSVRTLKQGIPVTRPGRTLEDLRHTQPLFQRATRRALDLKLITDADLGPEPDLTRSELERRFLALCRRHRLPSPEVNARLGPYEVDFLWRDRGVVVETDGFRYHGNRAAFESDRARDAALQALGFRVLRFTYGQVLQCPREVIDPLRKVMGP